MWRVRKKKTTTKVMWRCTSLFTLTGGPWYILSILLSNSTQQKLNVFRWFQLMKEQHDYIMWKACCSKGFSIDSILLVNKGSKDIKQSYSVLQCFIYIYIFYFKVPVEILNYIISRRRQVSTNQGNVHHRTDPLQEESRAWIRFLCKGG